MPYSSAATKAMKAMQKTYGSNWKHVYYGLANKRSGRGLRGAHRGHIAANRAFAKGSHWPGSGRRGRRSGVRRGRAGRANVRTL